MLKCSTAQETETDINKAKNLCEFTIFFRQLLKLEKAVNKHIYFGKTYKPIFKKMYATFENTEWTWEDTVVPNAYCAEVKQSWCLGQQQQTDQQKQPGEKPDW